MAGLINSSEDALQRLKAALNNAKKIGVSYNRKFAGVSIPYDIDTLKYIRDHIADVKSTPYSFALFTNLLATLEDYFTNIDDKIKNVGDTSAEGVILTQQKLLLDKLLISVIPKLNTPQQKFTELLNILELLITDEYIEKLNNNPSKNRIAPQPPVQQPTFMNIVFDATVNANANAKPVVGQGDSTMLRIKKTGAKYSSMHRILYSESHKNQDLDTPSIIDKVDTKFTKLKVKPINQPIKPAPTGIKNPIVNTPVEQINKDNIQEIYKKSGVKFSRDSSNNNIYQANINMGNNTPTEKIWSMTAAPKQLAFNIDTAFLPPLDPKNMTTKQLAAVSLWDGVDTGAKGLIGSIVGHREARVFVGKINQPTEPEADTDTITKNMAYIAQTSINLLKINVIPKFDTQTTNAVKKYMNDNKNNTDRGIRLTIWQLEKIEEIQDLYKADKTDSSLRNILTRITDIVEAYENEAKGSSILADKRGKYGEDDTKRPAIT